MKIAARVIQDKNIKEHSENEFHASYKGHEIDISTDHGHGSPKYSHLKRFDITVTDHRGGYAVNTWEDLHSMRDAIIYGLNGAKL